MSPLEIDALPGAALDPAIARLQLRIDFAKAHKHDVELCLPFAFAQEIVEIMERARDALLQQAKDRERSAEPAKLSEIGERCAPILAQHNGVKTHDRRIENSSRDTGEEGKRSRETPGINAVGTSGTEHGAGVWSAKSGREAVADPPPTPTPPNWSAAMTRDEWKQRYAKRVMDVANAEEHQAMYFAEVGAETFEQDERAAGNAIEWDDPEDMADEEMDCWDDDGDGST